jgi:murein DD-endopeptidase MepM/ murein hydrolase activator NlpD
VAVRPIAKATVCSCLFLSAAGAPAAGAVSSTGGTQYGQPSYKPASRPLEASSQSDAMARTARAIGARHLKRGSHGRLVRMLQQLLREAGYRVRTHGRFDAATERSVRRFQRLHQLSGGGIVDEPTATALASAAAAALSAQTQDAGWVFPLTPVGRVAAPRYWTLDQGVDLGGTHGDCGPELQELAVASGKIVKLGIDGFGSSAPVLRLDSGPDAGRYVYYGHAAPALVSVGQHVVAGQPIADVGCGTVGISSTPHLEIGISGRGGGSCCPGVGETSRETLTQLKYAYRYARAHPETQPSLAG